MISDEIRKHQAVPHATMRRQRCCWSGCGFTPCATNDGFEMARILIGTSGWHYDSWRGPFVPEGLPLKQQLHYYANQFDSAELNGVFYRTPTPESVKAWREQTGKDFVFAWKASKFITHWKRLSDACENSLDLSRIALKSPWQDGPNLVPATTPIRGERRPARFVLQAVVEEASLQPPRAARPDTVDANLAVGRAKADASGTFEEAAAHLSSREFFSILSDASALSAVLQKG